MDEEKLFAELCKATVETASKPFLEKIKILWSKQTFGVTLTPEEAESIKTVISTTEYKTFKQYLGFHWSNKLIKVGMYLSKLNEAGRKERAAELTKDAYRRWGKKGVRILHLASTGTLIPVMDYIMDLKRKKEANCIILRQEFDKILEDWSQITIPISNDCSEEDIENKIMQLINSNCSIFFVYASGHAAIKAQLLLAKMNNNKKFSNLYLMFLHKNVVNTMEYYLWTFEKVEDLNAANPFNSN